MRIIVLILCLTLAWYSGYSGLKRAMGYGFTMDSKGAADRVIRLVLDGSPAKKAGLKEGDVIVSVCGVPTTGLTNEAIIGLLKDGNEIVLAVERAGVNISVTMSKAPQYTYDRKCLYGNCIDGKGRAVFWGSKLQYEAVFGDGGIVGPCKIFDSVGILLYEGMVEARKPNGVGKKYGATIDKKVVLLSDGSYVNNIIAKGTTYTDNGEIESSGTYDVYGRLTSGFFSGGYRYGYVFYFCADIRYDEEGQLLLNGQVVARERKVNNAGRIESEGGYVNGKRSGLVKEWDYYEGVRHHITYVNGVATSGTIYRISDDAVVGRNVHYKSDVGDAMTINYITGGTFLFGKQPKEIDLKDGEVIHISNIKQMCENKGTVAIAPLEVPDKITKTEPSANTTKSAKDYTNFKANVAMYNFHKAIKTIEYEVQALVKLRMSINASNYDEISSRFHRNKEAVIAHINNAKSTYNGQVPATFITQLEQLHHRVMYDIRFPDKY